MADSEQSPITPLPATRPSTEPGTIVVVINGPVDPNGIPLLCECLRQVLEGSDADQIICDVADILQPDAVTVDALARLQLTARRLGRQVRFRDACGELRELLALMGLRDVLLLCAELPFEPRGQAEEREQPLGVEEERDPADPPG